MESQHTGDSTSSQPEDVVLSLIDDEKMIPAVIEPKGDRLLNIVDWVDANRDWLMEVKLRHAGVLMRGFKINGVIDFEEIITKATSAPLPYTERTSPRDSVHNNIYTSTSHRSDQEIVLHSEQSYNLQFPKHIFFYCETPAERGGATPIADTRRVFERIPESIVKQFLAKKYALIRNFRESIGLTWQTSYGTNDRRVVERYCHDNKIDFAWGSADDIELTTRQVRPCLAQHPDTGEVCWFNHCMFFNIESLAAETKRLLGTLFEENEMPNNTVFGDGARIHPGIMRGIRDAYEAEKVEFEWRAGDVLMLDNILAAHGRTPFNGERKVLAGMADLQTWSDLEVALLNGISGAVDAAHN